MPGPAAGTAPAASFGKDRRIRKRGEFSAVFDAGQRVHGRFFTFLFRQNGLAGPRLGIVASRKLGGAVERNRAKRLIREMFREQVRAGGPVRPAVDLVVIPKRELMASEFSAAVRDFQHTWRRAVGRRVGAQHA